MKIIIEEFNTIITCFGLLLFFEGYLPGSICAPVVELLVVEDNTEMVLLEVYVKYMLSAFVPLPPYFSCASCPQSPP